MHTGVLPLNFSAGVATIGFDGDIWLTVDLRFLEEVEGYTHEAIYYTSPGWWSAGLLLPENKTEEVDYKLNFSSV